VALAQCGVHQMATHELRAPEDQKRHRRSVL
jgi:hypothetical protein